VQYANLQEIKEYFGEEFHCVVTVMIEKELELDLCPENPLFGGDNI